ncbi:hypothetical protein BTVI_09351 [Pitangus sulphuratus]|nr:hypothetical protein BTVI_09351 [Pitangus sulphuratus]
MREAKAQFELSLATFVRGNKKCFSKNISSERRGKENLHSLLDRGRNIVTKDEGEKAEVLNTFFASVFNSKAGCFQDNWPPELADRDRKPNSPLIIQEGTGSDLLSHLDPHKFMGLEGIHTRVMRELAEELAKLVCVLYQQSWLSGEVPDDWKLVNVTPIHKKGRKEDLGNSRPVSLTSVPGKVMEQIILSAITQHLQDEQGIRSSQGGFRKGRSCLTNLISFYDQVTHLVNEGKAVDVSTWISTKSLTPFPTAYSMKKLAAQV